MTLLCLDDNLGMFRDEDENGVPDVTDGSTKDGGQIISLFSCGARGDSNTAHPATTLGISKLYAACCSPILAR